MDFLDSKIRIERNKLHKLLDIIVIAICGAGSWVDIEVVGIKKITWLRQFLELHNGISSHDTFGRVFGPLNVDGYNAVFMNG